MTRPVFVALAGLVAVGIAAVLIGAAVREHRDPTFRPDWAVWVPVSLGIGLGVLGLASVAMIAQRLPPEPLVPAGPFPRPIAAGTDRALLRGESLSGEQAASVQDLVDQVSSRRQVWPFASGPLYLLAGGIGSIFGHASGLSVGYLVLGALWCTVAAAFLRRRRRILERAAELGYSPRRQKAS